MLVSTETCLRVIIGSASTIVFAFSAISSCSEFSAKRTNEYVIGLTDSTWKYFISRKYCFISYYLLSHTLTL